MMLRCRPAQLSDSRQYLLWANEPLTRLQSFQQKPISADTHAAWFARQLTSPDTLLFVFETPDKTPVGQIRFQRHVQADLPAETVVSLSVDAAFRGRGLATQMIVQGCMLCRERWGAVTIHAYIKAQNRASRGAFERAGFSLWGESDTFVEAGTGHPSLLYVQEA